MANDDNTKTLPATDLSRRNMLKGAGALAAAAGLSAVDPASAQVGTCFVWIKQRISTWTKENA